MRSMFKSITIKSGQSELDTRRQETPKNTLKLRTPAEVYRAVVTLGSHCIYLSNDNTFRLKIDSGRYYNTVLMNQKLYTSCKSKI